MKFHIATKLALVLILVGMAAAAVTGYFVYGISRDLLVESAKNRLLTSTQELGRKLLSVRQETVRDLHTIAEHPLAQAVLLGNDGRSGEQMATFFRLIMETHPAYEQIRLISADHHGLEVIRFDRRHHVLYQISPDDLQEKGHYAYVSETLKLPAREAYMSRISGRQEPAVDAGWGKPSMHLAMPVVSAQGKAIGVVVITLDITHTFSTLVEDLPREFELYLANGRGDILIHPDQQRTFGFDTGRRTLIQEEFPPTQTLIGGQNDRALFETTRNSEEKPMVAAFIRQGIEIASEDDWLYLGLTQPLADVLAESQQLQRSISQSMLILLPVCLFVGILLARVISRPINQLTDAAHRFASGETIGHLPLKRKDEIGDLARSFQQMQWRISEQLLALHQNKIELEQLVRHDPLTGLPNRRLLHERLEQAIALSRRGNTGIALLFVDLDDFKGINDTLGHDAGDTVLVTVAQRLLEKVRVTDTVARLGGDEFVVLLVGTPHQEAVSAIATSLIESISDDIPLEGQILNVHASIGISLYPENGFTASELLSSADRAMYRVKTGEHPGFAFAGEAPAQPARIDEIAT